MSKEKIQESYGTLSETLNELFNVGYTHDFNIKDECIVCRKTNVVLPPEEFDIDKVYRFEGSSDPDYQSVLYAISSSKYNIKGTLVNGYGISSDEETSRLIEKLSAHKHYDGSDFSKIDATSLRPDGERVLNASLVELNLYELVEKIKNESTWSDSDRNSMTVFKSETMRIVLVGLHDGAELKPHRAKGVLCVQVLEGQIEFGANEQTFHIEKGGMVALQANITHGVIALADSFFLLTVSIDNN